METTKRLDFLESKLAVLTFDQAEVLREATETKCGIMVFYEKEHRTTDGERVECKEGEFFATDTGEEDEEIPIKIDPKDVVTTIIIDVTFTPPTSIDPEGEIWFTRKYHANPETGEITKRTQSMMFSEKREKTDKEAVISAEARTALENAHIIEGTDVSSVDSNILAVRDQVEQYIDTGILHAYTDFKSPAFSLETHVPKWLTEDPGIPDLDDPDMPFLLLEKFPKSL